MNLAAGLFAVLKGNATVAGIVANSGSPITYRIFPSRIPQGENRPAIRYDLVSTVRSQGLDGPTAYATSRFQIDCWHTTEAGLRTLTDAVVAAIDGTRGAWGAATIQHAYLEDVGSLPEFDDDEKTYRSTMDLIILASD